jgi:perosamine synthetase
MYKTIPHNKPNFDSKEIDAVKQTIESGHIVQGKLVKQLESNLSGFIGKKYCTAVSSGTMALSLALKSIGVTEKDEVIIPSYTCSALYHAIKFCNARVVYADIEEETCNLSPDSVREQLTRNTKAIIFPHMFGQPGYIKEILGFGVPVIEDIAQSIGATIDNQPVGFFGEIAVASFYATKMLGAGEGGAIITNNKIIDNYIQDKRDYDESEDLTPRLNAKMTDITAAIALEQYSKLEYFIQQRKSLHKYFTQNSAIKFHLPKENEHFQPNYFRQMINVDDSESFIKYNENSNIQFRKPVYKPLHLYKQKKTLPITEKMWKSQVSIPIFVGLPLEAAKKIKDTLSKYEKK